MQRQRFESLWQDRDIRFDAPSSELSYRNGEKLIEQWPKVEDTKGNTGEIGRLMVTNLRLIWQSLNKPRINLSIGLGCISTLTSRMIHTKLRGKNESLYMMTKVNGTRYEFIFISLEPIPGVSKDIIEMISRICKAYVQTKLFRDLRLRSAIMSIDQKQLKMLSSEQIYNVINGVWNLSSDQGNLGTMYLTNIRIVWHANINELFNISLPFIQIRNIKVRDSKFGIALVIESSELSGGYVLGFRVDPVDKLNAVYEELNNLYTVHVTNPDFGVHQALTMAGMDFNANTTNNTNTAEEFDDPNSLMFMNRENAGNYQELLDENNADGNDSGQNNRGGGGGGGHSGNNYDPVLAYLAEGESSEKRSHQWTYDPTIGLSIENIKDGFTIESLWEVVENVNSTSKSS
ncbi:Bardet-Biedl syndrome 5 protein [Dermatophagoides farinae]|uniref:Bardet-Biedl syndrome 5 protein n=1 Tax=Dermatophagoides farinae TaxID=6954 RepID=UPI003F6279E0